MVKDLSKSELMCPICGDAMTTQHRLGFAICECDEHGTWLPKGVLKDMLWRFSRPDRIMLDQAREELERWRGPEEELIF